MKLPITYIPDFIPNASIAFACLWDELDWLDVAGPRLEYYINDFPVPYTYGQGNGRREYQPQRTHPHIDLMRVMLEKHTGTKFEVCFLNGYRVGQDQLGWHADDSPEMDDKRPIAIISLGAKREIYFRETPYPKDGKCGACNGSGHYDNDGSPPCGCCDGTGKATPPEVTKVWLESGSLCLMHPGMQDTHQHRIPKSSLQNCGPRISLTFRGYV